MKDDILLEADQRTNLAFSNQMEMLVFYLTDNQMYGINVFKIIEVIECPPTVTKIPNSHSSVKGTIDFRGKAVTTIDISEFLDMPPQDYKNSLSYVIVCEYNNNIQGLLITNPDKLITRSWDDIKSPSGMLSDSGYLTAIAYTDENEMIQILDIEKMLIEILGLDVEISKELINEVKTSSASSNHVLFIDDSKAARVVIQSVLDQLEFTYESFESASEAILSLESRTGMKDEFCMIICDIEMPGMDGFTFTRRLKQNPIYKDTFVLLHSSMSNPTNRIKAEQVGADDFIAKFQPDLLAKKIIDIVGKTKGSG